MKQKTLAAVALSMRDFPSLAAKFAEAAAWVERAAKQGAEMIVLPETINLWRGDGAGHPHPLPYAEAALDNWRHQAAPLIDAARRLKVGLALPLMVRERDGLRNTCFFISRDGEVVGRYDKINPTLSELEQGVQPGRPAVIDWEGLRVAGAICFDVHFPDVFEQQAALGAQLFVLPSLTPGGRQINYYAQRLGVPMVLAYPAWSRIVGCDGLDLAAGGERWETLRFGFGSRIVAATVNFDYVVLHADGNQEKMLEVQQQFGRRVRIRFDQESTLFHLESLADDLTADDVVKACGLTPLHAFYHRYEQARAAICGQSSPAAMTSL